MSASRGFTLLEVVAVLFIIGLTSMIVGPRLPMMMDRFDYALKREALERTLDNLSYQAYRDNQDLILSGTYTHAGRVEDEEASAPNPRLAPPKFKTLSVDPTAIFDITPITAVHPKLPLPEGWQLVVTDPIYFRASGFCKGGEAELRVGKVRYTYVLRGPRCEIGAAG